MRETTGHGRPLRTAYALAALSGLLCAAATNAATRHHSAVTREAEIRALRLNADHDAAELSIDLTAPAHYSLSCLRAPDRIVLDLDAHLPGRVHLPAAAGGVEAIRAAPRPHGGVRLVLAMATRGCAHSRWVQRPGAAHLVVGLGGVGGATPRLALASNPALPSETAQSPSPPRPVLAAHAPTLSDRDVVIAVDAGHGGFDPGATGPGGTHEKDVVLAIARELAARINEEPGMRAVLTRDRDEFLLLGERTRRARAAHADLFVSVHADSIRDRAVAGSSVYVLSERGASSEAAAVLAEHENAADLLGGIPLAGKDRTLQSVLLDLAQSANISASITAAQDVLGALQSVGEVRKPQVQQAGFVVLKSPAVPSMLIETAYISNPREEQRLRSLAHERELAQAVFMGLHTYFERNPPPGTRFARAHGATAVLAGATAAAIGP